MVLAITPGRLIPYVLEDERDLPEEKQTTWILRTLTGQEYDAVNDKIAARETEGDISIRPGRYLRAAVRAGLHDVHGVGLQKMKLDGDGQPVLGEDGGPVLVDIPFSFVTQSRKDGTKVRVARDSYLDQVPNQVLAELGEAILDSNKLTEDEAKN